MKIPYPTPAIYRPSCDQPALCPNQVSLVMLSGRFAAGSSEPPASAPSGFFGVEQNNAGIKTDRQRTNNGFLIFGGLRIRQTLIQERTAPDFIIRKNPKSRED